MKTYKLHIGWAIFLYIVVPIALGALIWFLIGQLKLNLFLNSVMVLCGIALTALAYIDAYKSKLILYEDKIAYINSIFSTRELMFNEIKGFRLADKYIFIYSNKKEKKNIKISTYFEKTDEILEILGANFPNLDVVDEEKVTEEILKSQDFGTSVPEREAKLKEAHNTATIITWVGIAIGAWVLVYPKPYEFAIYAALAFPIISLLVVKYYKGTIHIVGEKGKAYPSAGLAFAAPACGLIIRTLVDFNILDFSNVWKPSFIITIISIAIIFYGSKEFTLNKSGILAVIVVPVIAFAYSIGAVISMNCMLDKSEPETYSTRVISKTVSKGKTTTYKFELEPWGTQNEADDVTVTRELYETVEEGEEVYINYMKGEYNIPWYEVYKQTE